MRRAKREKTTQNWYVWIFLILFTSTQWVWVSDWAPIACSYRQAIPDIYSGQTKQKKNTKNYQNELVNENRELFISVANESMIEKCCNSVKRKCTRVSPFQRINFVRVYAVCQAQVKGISAPWQIFIRIHSIYVLVFGIVLFFLYIRVLFSPYSRLFALFFTSFWFLAVWNELYQRKYVWMPPYARYAHAHNRSGEWILSLSVRQTSRHIYSGCRRREWVMSERERKRFWGQGAHLNEEKRFVRSNRVKTAYNIHTRAQDSFAFHCHIKNF